MTLYRHTAVLQTVVISSRGNAPEGGKAALGAPYVALSMENVPQKENDGRLKRVKSLVAAGNGEGLGSTDGSLGSSFYLD